MTRECKRNCCRKHVAYTMEPDFGKITGSHLGGRVGLRILTSSNLGGGRKLITTSGRFVFPILVLHKPSTSPSSRPSTAQGMLSTLAASDNPISCFNTGQNGEAEEIATAKFFG